MTNKLLPNNLQETILHKKVNRCSEKKYCYRHTWLIQPLGKRSFFQSSGRLFSSLPTKQFLGNLSTSANSLSQTLQQRATELPSSLSTIQAKLQQRATELPSSLSSFQAKLQHLPTDIAHMPRDFESARDQFVSSKPSAEKQARKGSGQWSVIILWCDAPLSETK